MTSLELQYEFEYERTMNKTTDVEPIGETNRDGFEIETCGRCGGGGEYSFNLMHGSRCYGCGGSGKVFTKRGTAARTFYRELCMRPVSELQVGEFVRYSVSNKWRVISEIVRPDGTGSYMEHDGVRKYYTNVVLKGAYSQGTFETSTLESVRNEDERKAKLAAAIAYQATLRRNHKAKKV